MRYNSHCETNYDYHLPMEISVGSKNFIYINSETISFKQYLLSFSHVFVWLEFWSFWMMIFEQHDVCINQ